MTKFAAWCDMHALTPTMERADAFARDTNLELLKAVELALEFFYNPTKFNPLDVERTYEAAIRKAKS